MDTTNRLPAWAIQPATPHDRTRVEQARERGDLQIIWPDSRSLRAWAARQGWPTPRFGFQAAFLTKMLESDDAFALALQDRSVEMVIPVERYILPPQELSELDALYAARGATGRPTNWGVLVEALREIRRAIEAGVQVEIEGHTLYSWSSFYTWAHGRYHMLEDGYDSWIGDDKS
jgi:hypothetical protein